MSTIVCSVCGEEDHKASKCPTLHEDIFPIVIEDTQGQKLSMFTFDPSQPLLLDMIEHVEETSTPS
jgi:hypothetical protein